MDHPVITYLPAKEDIVIEEKEVKRYLGFGIQKSSGIAGGSDDIYGEMEDAIEEMIRECISLTREVMAPKACYGRYAAEVTGEGKILFPYGEVVSHDLTRNLQGCSEIFLFAATIGTEFDRTLRRFRVGSMAKSAVLQAAGAAAVEGLCDQLNDELKRAAAEEGRKTRPRYSPGYGDYILENQKGIFSVLQPARYIGLTLMDTLIMAPEKSVTAVIGIEG